MAWCRRCVAPTTALNVVLDENGICNLCHTYDELGPELNNYALMRPLLQQRFAMVRGQNEYDALVGLSGGKDSSYVAFRLARDYGLRLLLFTYDNGYLTAAARENIKHMVKALGHDHIFISPGPELQSAIARASMKRFGVPCIGCTFPGFLAAIKVAVERQIPYVVHGRSPAQMFKELAPGAVDPFLPFLQSNFKARNVQESRKFIEATSARLQARFNWFISDEVRDNVSLSAEIESLYRVCPEQLASRQELPEFLAYFLFEPYDENRIKAELERELHWKRPEDDRFMGHNDCAVHAAAVYLYTINYGHPILQPELGTLIRQGALTREEACARLSQEVESIRCDEKSMQSLAEITGLNREELIRLARRSHRRLAGFRWCLQLRHRLFGSWLKTPLALK